ncbi:Beige/BEACH domain containing protein [Histomonas meleagridis]|uniref:Beige/BEACH domain containing protein n=1 Tax=Histomonas meleagridis TaxID=135588 RepID=UPI003559C7B2|nr:Beige/BEACH domain containing protein [Histomonas meleagridis]KAH0796527.1 Beige/BEACH domain containing protein [Histomonas meleagridis]
MTKIVDGNVKKALALYNINGDFIRMKELEFGVCEWNCFASNDGFDFVVLCNEIGECFVFEAFFLELNEKVVKVDSDVCDVNVLMESAVVAVTLKNGNLLFAPIELE